MQRKDYLQFYVNKEKIKRLARITFASLLLVEPLILPLTANEANTKGFKNQMNNSIKMERMGDKVSSQKQLMKIEINNIEDFIESVYKRINDKKFDEQYREWYKKLPQNEKKKFDEKVKEWLKQLEIDNKKLSDIINDPNKKGKEPYKSLFEKIENEYNKKNNKKKVEEKYNLRRALENVENTGTGTAVIIEIDENDIRAILDYLNNEKLKEEYPHVASEINKNKLKIYYFGVDNKTQEQTEKSLGTVKKFFKERGFTEFYLVGAGSGSGESSAYSISILATGPNKRAMIGFNRVNEESKEFIRYARFEGSDSEKYEAEFKNLLTSKKDEIVSTLINMDRKKYTLYSYVNFETGIFANIYVTYERNEEGEIVKTTGISFTGNKWYRELIANEIKREENLKLISREDAFRFYKINQILKEVFNSEGYSSFSNINTSVANKTYEEGSLTVRIGDNLYLYKGKEAIELGDGNRLRFSGVLFKTQNGEPQIYAIAHVFNKDGMTLKSVEIPFYEKTKLSYEYVLDDKKLESEYEIYLEPSKELIEKGVNWDSLFYEITIGNEVVGTITPNKESFGKTAREITFMKDGKSYLLELKSIKNKAVQTSKPELYATIKITDQSTKNSYSYEIPLNNLVQISVGEKKLDIKINSPKWESIGTAVFETIETQIKVFDEIIKETDSAVYHNTVASFITNAGIDTFGTGTKIAGEIVLLNKMDKQMPVYSSSLTGSTIMIENPSTGEGAGISMFNADPYLDEGVFSSRSDVINWWAKKKVGVTSWFGFTGISGFSKTLKEVDQTTKEKKIKEFVEGYASSQYISLPYLINGEIAEKIKIWHQAIVNDKIGSGNEYEFIYDAVDWNKPGLWVLSTRYNRKTIENKEQLLLDQITASNVTGYTKNVDLFDIFRLVSIRHEWKETKYEYEINRDKISEHIIRFIAAGRGISVEAYGGIQNAEEYNKINKVASDITNTIVGLNTKINRRKWGVGASYDWSRTTAIKKIIYRNILFTSNTIDPKDVIYQNWKLYLEPWWFIGSIKFSLYYIGYETKDLNGEIYSRKLLGGRANKGNFYCFIEGESNDPTKILTFEDTIFRAGLGSSSNDLSYSIFYQNGLGSYSFNFAVAWEFGNIL